MRNSLNRDIVAAGITLAFGILMLTRELPRDVQLAIWTYLIVGQLVCAWKRIRPATRGREGINGWMLFWISYLWAVIWWPRYLMPR